jgi:hypothetical protein
VAWFSEVDLRVAAGPALFERGQNLLSDVTDMRSVPEGVQALVTTFEVFLGAASPGVIGECGCPAGGFCEHCVAVGLVLLGERNYAEAVRSVGSGTPQVVVLRRRVDTVLRVRGAVDQEGSREYARIAGETLDTVAELIGQGHAAEARPLARQAVELITESLLLIDDSFGLVVAVCQRALEIYAKACTSARPNPTKLAQWLFQLQLDSPGWPTVRLADFADALGDAGLVAYRARVDEAWDNRSDDDDFRGTLSLLLMRDRLNEGEGPSLADLPDGPPDPAVFLGVAAGEPVPWLVEFLVQAYVNGDRGHDALELRRSQLRSQPTRDAYAKLKDTASTLSRWADIRPWALDVLRASERGDELVGALLDDGASDEAWQAAEKYGCAPPLWLTVARLRTTEHPADVLPGFRALIENLAAMSGRPNYRRAAGLLDELRETAARCGRAAEVDEFVEQLRARHRRKRALLNELASQASPGSAGCT